MRGAVGGKDGTGAFSFTEDARTSFLVLKRVFTSAPILQHFELSKPIRVETDASGFGIVGILSQLGEEGDLM